MTNATKATNLEATASHEKLMNVYDQLAAIHENDWNYETNTHLAAIARDYPETLAKYCKDVWEKHYDL